VLVGAGTVLADDPALTVRLPGYAGAQPRPVVVVGRRPLPAEARIWQGHPLVLAPAAAEYPAQVVPVPGPGGVDLSAGLRVLAEHGLLELLVEGGPTLAGALLRAGLVDRGVFYLGALLGGGQGKPALAGDFGTLAHGRPVRIESAAPLGRDVRIEFSLEEG
jgi:diaminohydroxyphosphoribosylaminopyrimidine deaminase/5-amino-6-(5-phosphoribosylamino)uracil reductase